jgi:protein required for attachment to host cells
MGTWVLVADSSRARLLNLEKNRSLTEVEAFVCPEERLREQDLTSDRGGRSFDSRGGGRHGMEPVTSQREQLAIEFAKQIAERLDGLRSSGAMDQLVLIAAPTFLGHLRAKLSGETEHLIALSIDKDLTQHKLPDIAGHIPAVL